MLRTLFKALSILAMFRAVKRGRPGQYFIGRIARRQLMRQTRKIRF